MNGPRRRGTRRSGHQKYSFSIQRRRSAMITADRAVRVILVSMGIWATKRTISKTPFFTTRWDVCGVTSTYGIQRPVRDISLMAPRPIGTPNIEETRQKRNIFVARTRPAWDQTPSRSSSAIYRRGARRRVLTLSSASYCGVRAGAARRARSGSGIVRWGTQGRIQNSKTKRNPNREGIRVGVRQAD